MAEARIFRSALNGFNREDVVRYIESLNAKHTALVNQLTSEKQSLATEQNKASHAYQTTDRSQPTTIEELLLSTYGAN